MGAAKHTPEHTYTHKAHISIHSCRAVRSNLDSCREWIVMQRGGRWAQTGCQRAAARLCPTCLFLPCGVQLFTIPLLQVFFLSPITRPTIVTSPYLTKQIPGFLEQSTVLGDFSQTKHICVPLVALVLHANANRLFKWHRMWSSNSWWAKIKFNLKNAFKLCAFSGHTYLYDYTWWEAVRKLQVLLHLLVMTDTK